MIKAGGVTNPVRRRLIKYYQIAVEIGADLILNTCSSVGEVVDLGRALIDVPIVKIDEPMAKHAAANYQRIGSLPLCRRRLSPRQACAAQAQTLGKDITIIDGWLKALTMP